MRQSWDLVRLMVLERSSKNGMFRFQREGYILIAAIMIAILPALSGRHQ